MGCAVALTTRVVFDRLRCVPQMRMCGWGCWGFGSQMAYLGSCALLGFTSQVCMTIGMQRSKPAVASIMRQTGVLYAFLYQLLLVPGEHILDSTYIGAVVIVISIGGLGLCQVSLVRAVAWCGVQATVCCWRHHPSLLLTSSLLTWLNDTTPCMCVRNTEQLKQAQSTQSSQVEMQRASPRARLKVWAARVATHHRKRSLVTVI